jgi:annexin A7/11
MAREIREDLSLSTARLFEYVLIGARVEESAPVLPHDVEHNVDRIQQATMGTKMGTNQDVVSHVMASSSDGMIRAINIRYLAKYRTDLDTLYKNHFSGHMQDALRQMAARAVDPVKSDAMDLERSMKGMGTRDDLLVTRLVRCHWDRNRMHQVKAAYRTFHNRDLSARVSGETSGDYKRLMVALCS